jgi:hypothetical protein
VLPVRIHWRRISPTLWEPESDHLLPNSRHKLWIEERGDSFRAIYKLPTEELTQKLRIPTEGTIEMMVHGSFTYFSHTVTTLVRAKIAARTYLENYYDKAQ